MTPTQSIQKSKIRIANASGYWGDDPTALGRQVRGGEIDYVSLDFLAEITMSIMQKQRSKDPEAGYARDFVTMLEGVLPEIMKRRIKIIANAGGVNPMACARAIKAMAGRLGLRPRIAIVHGDDILSQLPELRTRGNAFKNMETGEDFDGVADRVQSANVYFGAKPVVEALKHDPDIIVTGRVTDTGITLAPMIHAFGWGEKDWDRLAAGIVAGHMIECGSQSTGGNFTDWRKVKSFDNIGYPIVEVSADGTFVITKHENTGGLVSVDTVREQLLYEMGHPKAYITPDVVADFSTIQLTPAGANRVKVTGIKGYEPTELYKVSMAYGDGFKALGTIIISGPDARAKAEKFADIFWTKCGRDQFEATETEYMGWNSCQRSLGGATDGAEITLRLGVRAKNKELISHFSKLVPSLILGGPPGVAVLGGAPKPQDVVSYWPALMPKSALRPIVGVMYDQGLQEFVVEPEETGKFVAPDVPTQTSLKPDCSVAEVMAQPDGKAVALSTICLGRSGDKGDTSNIGMIARSPKAYAFIQKWLTAQRVKNYFQEICFGKVVRYNLDNLMALNFLLEESLGGGGTMTLRADAQGKTFAQALLRQRVCIPQDVLDDVQSYERAQEKV